MSRSTEQTVDGTVLERLPNRLFLVELADGRQILCHLSGRMKRNNISVLEGDAVEVLLDPYGGHATNRITYRR